jgi:signal transduction histidine kinase
MQTLFYRPVIIILLILGLLAFSELFALGGITWKNLKRINSIKQDIQESHHLEQLLFDSLSRQSELTFSVNHIDQFIETQTDIKPSTLLILRNIQQSLKNPEKQMDKNSALRLLSQIVLQQIQKEETLLDKIYSDSQLELKLAILIPSGFFLIILFLGQWFFHRQIITPIKSLDKLLSNLIEGKKQPLKDQVTDPMLRPLFNNYNRLVTRLIELEEEHRHYTQSLRQEVHNATHALLEQSHSLARAERLAAVGELAASAAHELRNPLAGIQVALENIQEDCLDSGLNERLALVNSEIKRLTGRLNDLLDYSRHPPEKAIHFALYPMLEELLTLLSYQVNKDIQLGFQLEPQNLVVFLPPSELRQALLNLFLNAIQSIGENLGKIHLTVYQQNDYLHFKLHDSGPGFPDSLLQQGIRPFASYKKHGTGLGLPMVRRFAKAHGGQLEISNDEHHHGCVMLSLKINP